MQHLKIFETETAFEENKATLESPCVALTEDDTEIHIVYNNEPLSSDFVDLGLPGGLKWASHNLGAKNPYDYGDFYQWGAVTPSAPTECDWAHAPFNDGESDFNSTYFFTNKDEWFVNNVLKSEYDAAVAAVKGRMPTTTEQQTLKDNTYWQWIGSDTDVVVKVINDDGTITAQTVKYPAGFFVYKVKDDTHKGQMNTADISALYDYNYHPAGESSPAKEADAHIFFPASGYDYGTGVDARGLYGGYWSSSLDSSNPLSGRILAFHDYDIYIRSHNRYCGYCVRSVAEN